MTEYDILKEICDSYNNILGSKLTGIYVHGSIAFGCFHRELSDIDFLVVVKEQLCLPEKKALIEKLLDLGPHCPKKGAEMSVVLESVCNPFVYPTPFELHYSIAHKAHYEADLEGYCQRLNGTDKDLAAHFTVIRKCGRVLCGKAIDQVFGAVPHGAYLDSIRYDIENAVDDIAENPVYMILNLCRVAAYLQEGLVLSKQEGGHWGLTHLPERFRGLIRSAVASYTDSVVYEPNDVLQQQFAAHMLKALL